MLLIFLSVVSAQPFVTSGKLANGWKWTPASGNPAHYIVEKFTSGVWNIVDTIPARVGEDGLVFFTVVSSSPEIYKIRVVAVDAAGNQGPASEDSDWLFVFPDDSPGRPIID